MAKIHRNRTLLYCIEAVAVIAGIVVIAALVYRARTSGRAGNTTTNVMPFGDQSLHGRQIFPVDDPWNLDISAEAVDENSNALIASIGDIRPLHPDFGTVYHGAPLGIPYVVVSGDQPKVPITFENATESDSGPYPIPPGAPIEGGPESEDDRHVLVVDKTNWLLYELYAAIPEDGGKKWRASSGAIFNLARPSVQRPLGWTSADAAGLPIFPGLVRYDEVIEQGKITHALRFTASRTRRAFVYPATHFASRDTDANLPPMGMRVRLKRDYDITAFPQTARVILQALKTHGMILADNGGNWFLSGAPDPRWNDDEINTLKNIPGSAFEVVFMGGVVTKLENGDAGSGVRAAASRSVNSE